MSFKVDPFTDSAMAAAACDAVFRDRFIHVHNIGWLAYDGGVWREVPTKAVVEALREWTSVKLTEAVAAYVAGTATKETVKGWTSWQQATRLRAAVELASGLPSVSVRSDELDTHPDLLNCPNGVVDLRTGELRPSMPWYYFTKVTGCEYDPKAVHEDWDAALECLPESVVTWLQIRYGQAATGHMPPDDKVIIQSGGGENGKSTLLGAVTGALGAYYLLASDRILMDARESSHTTELAALRGARFVAVEETPEAGRLNVMRLKKVTTPQITARHLYQRDFTFDSSHSLFVNTNFIPVVNETDHGTWRRLVLVVFPFKFVKADPIEAHERLGDPNLRIRVKSGERQHRAALAWIVEGARRWYAADQVFPDLPAIVGSDTDEWRGNVDHIGAFWEERLVPDKDCFVAGADLVSAYNAWADQLGLAKIAAPTFKRRFQDHELTLGAGVIPTVLRLGPRQILRVDRPYLKHEAIMREPLAAGTVRGWRGLAFRPEDHDATLRNPASVTGVTDAG